MKILLTGITGLIGSHVALDLLSAGHHVSALTRRRNGDGPAARVRDILQRFPGFESGRHDLARLAVPAGNILSPCCGLPEADLDSLHGNVEAIVHCAGIVSFSPRADQESLSANTEGVRHVVELASRINCPRVIHISTAYIDQGLRGEGFRTHYEESKYNAEELLRDLADKTGVSVTIVRPSIVTGDQQHGFTPTCNGIHPFMRYVALFREDLRPVVFTSWLPGDTVERGTVNLVPADHLAAVIRAVAEQPNGSGQEINITNPNPWRLTELGEIAADFIGAPESPASGPVRGPAGRLARSLTDRYGPYFTVQPVLDTTATEKLMGKAGIPPIENSPDWIRALLGWWG